MIVLLKIILYMNNYAIYIYTNLTIWWYILLKLYLD